MIYVIHNSKYVAAVTNSAKKLTEWLRETELPKDMKIVTLDKQFPLYMVENDMGFHFYSGDDETKQVAHYAKTTHGTLYTVPDCWRGTAGFGDYMGVLDHTHFDFE